MKKLAMVVLSLAMLTACRLFGVKEISSMSPTPQYSIEDAERIARIKIPAEAYEVQIDVDMGWMDDLALIKFKLPSDRLQPFLEEIGFQHLEKGKWTLQDFYPNPEWWPQQAQLSQSSYLGGERDFPGYSQSILVDISNLDVYTVYFQCFEV